MRNRTYRLYELFDQTGRALYVGYTHKPVEQRLTEHARHPRNQWWAPLIDPQRTIITELGTSKRQALRTEAARIRTAEPLANSVHNNNQGVAFARWLQYRHETNAAGWATTDPIDRLTQPVARLAPLLLTAAAAVMAAAARW